uniref:Uncharacterized protein n=1 Tax=Eutreptiella gymnastica TaxID=73025 RepID=A0A7S1N450_9EUGL|mmetsp:Transcript_115914/g.201690  ORF Transcript_115914/g.201690 Transcript_115914/m.201690 type:complete len:461 (+) Transcript_115914:69-1451(+)
MTSFLTPIPSLRLYPPTPTPGPTGPAGQCDNSCSGRPPLHAPIPARRAMYHSKAGEMDTGFAFDVPTLEIEGVTPLLPVPKAKDSWENFSPVLSFSSPPAGSDNLSIKGLVVRRTSRSRSFQSSYSGYSGSALERMGSGERFSMAASQDAASSHSELSDMDLGTPLRRKAGFNDVLSVREFLLAESVSRELAPDPEGAHSMEPEEDKDAYMDAHYAPDGDPGDLPAADADDAEMEAMLDEADDKFQQQILDLREKQLKFLAQEATDRVQTESKASLGSPQLKGRRGLKNARAIRSASLRLNRQPHRYRVGTAPSLAYAALQSKKPLKEQAKAKLRALLGRSEEEVSRRQEAERLQVVVDQWLVFRNAVVAAYGTSSLAWPEEIKYTYAVCFNKVAGQLTSSDFTHPAFPSTIPFDISIFDPASLRVAGYPRAPAPDSKRMTGTVPSVGRRMPGIAGTRAR